ncbi:MAG TPA: L-threonylcarbamoyladenylate synthase [Balneolaceae bacterium]|nr:L-threonylcarbamoyladenylate synthase [Balneolaceae bacterium]
MLNKYVDLLKKGEIVAFPTETVYGLGADAWNPSAVRKVFEKKGRPADNPLIVHVSSKKSVEEFASEISEDARKLMKHFWPGPLTLIFPKKAEVLDIITAGLDTVAVRWPMHPLSQELIALAGPLVAPSANSSGKPSPTKAEHVKKDFGDDFSVIEGGETNIGLESTVLDISAEPYRIYRPGAVSAEEIEKVVGKTVEMAQPSPNTAAKSPGTKYTHYSPDARVQWLDKNTSLEKENMLYLLHGSKVEQEFLHSASGIRHPENIIHYRQDYRKLAHELYDRFRQADHEGYATITIEPFSKKIVENHPIIPAIINRISKAVD